MAVHFSTRLQAAGCTIDVTAFRDRLADLLAKLHGDWNDEDLMHNPREALAYCDTVRSWPTCGGLSDELILRMLSGTRKHSA